MSRVVAVAAFAIAGILFLAPSFSAHEYECSECSSQSECGQGLSCRPFSDGKSRCVSKQSTCHERHIDTGGTWSHMGAVAALVIGGCALSWRRLTAQSRESAMLDGERHD